MDYTKSTWLTNEFSKYVGHNTIHENQLYFYILTTSRLKKKLLFFNSIKKHEIIENKSGKRYAD